jgi:hypothetical protein
LDESIATVGSGMSLNSFHIPHLLFFRCSFLANFSFHQFIFPFQHSISAVVDRLESRCHHPSVVHSPPNSLSFPSLLCRLRSCGTTQFSILHEHTRSKTQETVYKWDTRTEYCANGSSSSTGYNVRTPDANWQTPFLIFVRFHGWILQCTWLTQQRRSSHFVATSFLAISVNQTIFIIFLLLYIPFFSQT